MPTYEFYCDNCGNRFEEFLSISIGAFTDCPACGHKARKKISAGIGLIFKGPRFYTTDYKKPENRDQETADKSS